jgi:peptidoglycan/xylan/chitin deacetylase (PgdA/CDA1 family)
MSTPRNAARQPPPAGIPGPTLPYSVKAGLTRARSAAWHARSRGRADASGLRILLYHRVADDDDPLSVSPRRFAEQMARLAADGFRAVDLTEALALLDAGEFDGRTIGLTFDDGFADVAEHALPALERHGFRATVFVTTGVADGRAAFPWYAAPQPPVLRWDDIVALDLEGTLRFEAHTVTHPSLPILDEDTARGEIADSRRDLAERLGRPVTAFAYPAGLFGPRERRLVAQAGYAAAVSCDPGVNGPGTDRLALRRRQIDRRDRMADFTAKVRGGHDTQLPLRDAYLRLRSEVGRRRRASSAR